MYRFRLNDELKQFIKEDRYTRNKVEVIRDYLRETEYDVDVSIDIGTTKLNLSNVKLLPDWEQQCFRVDIQKRSDGERLQNIFDFNNTFKIPFGEFLNGCVTVRTFWYGQIDVTETFIFMIIDAMSDELVGYKYSFVKEAFNDPFKYVYKINNQFFEVSYSSAGVHDTDTTPPNDKLILTDPSSGQYKFRTAFELLTDELYISNLDTDEDGLIIPHLKIEKYEKVK